MRTAADTSKRVSILQVPVEDSLDGLSPDINSLSPSLQWRNDSFKAQRADVLRRLSKSRPHFAGKSMPLRGQDPQSGRDEEHGSPIHEKTVLRKLNQHILLKFFLMCILCYIGEDTGLVYTNMILPARPILKILQLLVPFMLHVFRLKSFVMMTDCFLSL